ncbi:fimbrial protein [Pseudomonas sp. MOB-449]|nr:fimbrial protein [Pseudomonas sp. MOB-449]
MNTQKTKDIKRKTGNNLVSRIIAATVLFYAALFFWPANAVEISVDRAEPEPDGVRYYFTVKNWTIFDHTVRSWCRIATWAEAPCSIRFGALQAPLNIKGMVFSSGFWSLTHTSSDSMGVLLDKMRPRLSVPYSDSVLVPHEKISTNLCIGVYVQTIFVHGSPSWAPCTPVGQHQLTSCAPAQQQKTVSMGNVSPDAVRNGNAPIKTFTIDVNCIGSTGSGAGSVRMYFLGDSTSPGLLSLDQLPGAAKGIALRLRNQDNSLLQFGPSYMQPIPLQRGGGYLAVYTYTGTAQYEKTTDNVSSGVANASLTYVIEYN